MQQVQEQIPTNPKRLKYLLDEGFITKDGEGYRYYTEKKQKHIIKELLKHGKKITEDKTEN